MSNKEFEQFAIDEGLDVLDDDAMRARYDEMLDECYPFTNVS